MALITTKAIVLSTLKYGDTSLIVKCFTLNEGVRSYMLRGVLKSKKGKLRPAYFQSLNQLMLTANHNNKGTLNTIKEVRVINPYENIYTSVIKQTIVMFLSEILSNIIQEEEKNEVIYQYIETSLIWLDTHDDIANFHLLFLLNLSRFLGFYPDVSESEKLYFNLIEGKFTNNTQKFNVSGGELILFKSLLGTNFDAIDTILYNKKERQIILRIVIQYFELHLEGFRKPKSLGVLETVFS